MLINCYPLTLPIHYSSIRGMKILARGKNRLYKIYNLTEKRRDIELRDGDTLVVKIILMPRMIYEFPGLYFTKDIHISGKGSRGAIYKGFNIEFKEWK